MKKLLRFKKNILEAIRVGFFLANRQIKRSGKGTTALIIFIMVLTFLNLVVVSGLLVGLISGSFKQFKESYASEVIITSAAGRDYIENSPELVAFLNNHPKVQAISPRYGVSVQVLGDLKRLPGPNERPNSMGGRLTGIDLDAEENITQFSRFIQYGQPLEEGDEGYILIGANLLKKYSSFADANIPGLDLLEDVDIGSRVRVSFTVANNSKAAIEQQLDDLEQRNGDTNSSQNNVENPLEKVGTVTKEFVIKGIVKSKVDEISTRMFIPADELKRLLPANKDQYQEIAVKTDPAYAIQLVEEIKNFMGKNQARVQTANEAIPSFLRDIETTMAILGNALSSIALVVASITVFIVIFINAVTRRKFIGIMKGIGISPPTIVFSYIFQAIFYGVIGSAIGLILTFFVLKPYFDAHPINFPFSDGILVATPEGAFIRVAILLVVTIIAGYLPAKIIVRKNTLDSILGR